MSIVIYGLLVIAASVLGFTGLFILLNVIVGSYQHLTRPPIIVQIDRYRGVGGLSVVKVAIRVFIGCLFLVLSAIITNYLS